MTLSFVVFYLPILAWHILSILATLLYLHFVTHKKLAEATFPGRLDLWFMERETSLIRGTREILDLYVDWLLADGPLRNQVKEKFMKAINPSSQHPYVCKSDLKLDAKERTTFSVSFLTADQQSKLRNGLYSVTGMGKQRKESLNTGSSDMEALKMGLKGWTNFKNEDGTEVVFDPKKVGEMIDFIPPDARSEIAAHIKGESQVDEGNE